MSQIQLINLSITDLKCLVSDVVRDELRQKPVKDPDQLLTSKEAQSTLSVNASTLWRWQKRGYLTPVKIGGLLRYRLSDLQKLLSYDE